MSLIRRFVAILTVSAVITGLMLINQNKKNLEKIVHPSTQVRRRLSSPLLVLFTTVKEDGMIPHHQFAFNAVLTNWPSFKPYIQPALFLNLTNSSLARRAVDAGWDVLPLTRTNRDGTPFLKDLYRTIFDRYDAMLYGYTSGDILFDDGLLRTLEAVEKKMAALINNVLLIGRRINIDVDLSSRSVSMEQLQKDRLRDLANKKGQLFRVDAIDYFFLSKEGCSLNWTKLIDVVIGRPAFDNYFVAMAIRDGVQVIDSTDAVLAIHLTETKVFSHGALNADSRYNKNLIGPEFAYEAGHTTAARLTTTTDFSGEIFIVRRN